MKRVHKGFNNLEIACKSYLFNNQGVLLQELGNTVRVYIEPIRIISLNFQTKLRALTLKSFIGQV